MDLENILIDSKYEYYEHALDSMIEGVIMVNSKAEVIFINKAARQILQIDTIDYVGKKVVDVVPNTRLQNVVESKKPEIDQIQSIGKTKIITSRIPLLDDQGNLKGAIAVFRDVTEIQRMAEEVTDLRRIRLMLEKIIESTDDAISVADKDGRVVMVNREYTKLTGFNEEEVIGKPATIDIAEGESVHMMVAKEKKPILGHRLKVGPMKKDVIVDVTPLFVDDKFVGSVGVIHDVSKILSLSRELEEANRMLRRLKAKYTFDDIIGNGRAMQIAITQAKKVAPTRATVLLRGESGTGKELFAHAIHNASDRRNNPFVSVNCAALPEGILESELFGYEEGAFTGARKGGRIGLLEEADGGTLFLDEIGKMELTVQSKFLRFLQEMEITKLGSSKTKRLDVRIISATNIDLEEMVKAGKFIPDLYYRINVVPIYIPPLRERVEDIEPLVKYIIRKLNQEYGRAINGISSDALKVIKSLPWPGNVRELENFIARAMINMDISEREIKLSSLPPYSGTYKGTLKHEGLKKSLAAYEKSLIEEALKANKGNRKETAKSLGISLRTLFYKMEEYQLK
ncbi:sigma-54 interaction domain-containing protein [Athalassotoga saccharophila]|uniref:sigma-54 interaction domain-containing protein n=1 Tax=Athalassotoga saccharophila TaxID=1441386 RepID=UPI00137A4C02|nr:sigma-54-dependent Fis family transcriptional regulator [Athalassotoga saccharophila]BBJ28352.1 arginine utilization regulatory protein RocR [Athalassotoga saccharophila]